MPPIQYSKETALANHFLLRHLRPEELKRLAGHAVLARHKAQSVIFQKGDLGTSAMAVIRGRVKICTFSADGREIILNIVNPGSLFGEVALLDGRERTADAVALEETDLAVLERDRFLPFLAANPEIAIRLLAVLSERLRQTSALLEDALLRETPSRIARGLLRLADTFGRSDPDGTRINIRLSQQQIGSLVGISRESVNRQVGEWTRAGHLAVDGGFIVLRDRTALERLAELE